MMMMMINFINVSRPHSSLEIHGISESPYTSMEDVVLKAAEGMEVQIHAQNIEIYQ